MKPVGFSQQADGDLEAIGDYIALESPHAAIRVVRSIRERCFRLAQAPHIGRHRPELATAIRSIAFQNYVIFYRVEPNEIRIERIIHGARDIDAIFDDDV